MNIKGRFI